MASTKSRIKYMHYGDLDEDDFYKMFSKSLKYGPALNALTKFFRENKNYLKFINKELGDC